MRELAQCQLYFRRLRIPPRLFVYWDRILVDPMMKKALSCLVRDHPAAIEQGHQALSELREMIAIAESTNIPTRGLKLQLSTFEIIAQARDYFFSGDDQAGIQLQQLKTRYKKRFKRNYSVFINLDAARVHRVPLRSILPLIVREQSNYRMLDQVLTVRLLGLLYPLARRFRHRIGPKFTS